MSNYSQSLVYRFNADTAPAKRAMIDMAQSGVSQMALLAGGAAAAGRKIDTGLVGSLAKLAASITGAQVAYVAFAAVAASSLGVAIERLGEYRKILADATASGVSTDFFQKFTQSAGQAVETAKVLAAALNTAKGSTREGLDGSVVGNRIDEFSRNGGFTAAGEAAREAYKNASNLEEKIIAARLAIDDLRATGRVLEGFDLASKLFGPDAADQLIARADKAGKSLTEMANTTADKKIVSPEQIENARKLEERLEASRKTMADGMRPVLEDLERLGVSIYSGWVGTQQVIAEITANVGALYKAVKSVADLLPSLNVGDGNNPAEVTKFLENKLERERARGLSGPSLERLEKTLAAARQRQGGDQLSRDAVPFIDLPGNPVLLGPNDPLARIGARPPRRSILDRDQPPPKSGKSGGGGSSTDSDLEFYEKYVASIEKAIAALKTETETLGLSTYEREKATLSSKAYAEFKAKDIELSDEQKAKIDQLIEAQARLKAQLEDTKNAMQAQREFVQFLGTNVSSFFSDIVSGGKNAGEAMMNLTKKLADAALQAALLGQGPLAKLFGMAGSNGDIGGIFGMLAKGFGFGSSSGFGSAVSWGTPLFDVGSQNVPRDMPAFVHQGEMILPRGTADRVRRGESLGPGGAGAVSVTVAASPELDARIASTSRNVSARVVQAAIGENNARIPAMLAENNAR